MLFFSKMLRFLNCCCDFAFRAAELRSTCQHYLLCLITREKKKLTSENQNTGKRCISCGPRNFFDSICYIYSCAYIEGDYDEHLKLFQNST